MRNGFYKITYEDAAEEFAAESICRFRKRLGFLTSVSIYIELPQLKMVIETC